MRFLVILIPVLSVVGYFAVTSVMKPSSSQVQTPETAQSVSASNQAAAKKPAKTASKDAANTAAQPSFFERLKAYFIKPKPEPDKGYGFNYGECSKLGNKAIACRGKN